jgi:hypothetical protein
MYRRMRLTAVIAVVLACWCLHSANTQAESFPVDGAAPTEAPKFSCGCRVEWVDGSRGRVVDRPRWQTEGALGQWYYPVRFGDDGSLCWLLPEEGLAPLESDDAGDPHMSR